MVRYHTSRTGRATTIDPVGNAATDARWNGTEPSEPADALDNADANSDDSSNHVLGHLTRRANTIDVV